MHYTANNSTQPYLWGVSERLPELTISYDPATKSYNLLDRRAFSSGETLYPEATVTFGTADRVSSEGYFDKYRVTNGALEDELALYGNARWLAGDPPLVLSYLSFGYWAHSNAGNSEHRQTYFLFGAPTGPARMPSGRASYQTLVSGSSMRISDRPNETVFTELGGSASFDVDFGTGSIATTLNLTTASDSSAIGTYSGTGTIFSSDQFKGTFSSSAADFVSGEFSGGFFGPGAAEMGYGFHLYHFVDGRAGASLRPSIQTYIEGVVVGAKQ